MRRRSGNQKYAEEVQLVAELSYFPSSTSHRGENEEPDKQLMDRERSMWLTRRRKEKHAATLDEWRMQLTKIREDCELEIAKTCREAAEQFVNSRRVADQIMANLSQQERNSPPFACLEEARIKIERFTRDRDNNINWLHRNLKEAESRRLEMVKTAIHHLKVKLPTCSHLPPIQVQNVICNEASQINHMLVLNHRRIAQLVGNLKMETAVATYRLQSEWEEYYKTWQQSNTTKLIEQFKDSAQKRIDVCPASVQALVLQLSEEFAKILMSRDHILQDFRTNFRLFAETPEKTEACLRDLQNLQERLVEIFPEYLEKIYKAFAEELDKIRHELQMLRETLLDEKFVKDEESLEQLVSELGQTVIEQLKMRAEGSLAYLEISFGWIVTTNQKHFFDPMAKFITELTRLWRVSGRESLRLQQTAFREELTTKQLANREKVDQLEIRLGQAIDDLRRADNEAEVDQLLEEALSMLQDIQSLREQHQKSVLDFLSQYPAQVAKVLLQFHKDVCQFFGVRRCSQAEVPIKLQKNLESMPPIFEKYLVFADPKTPRRRYTAQEATHLIVTPTAIFYAMSEEEVRREVYARDRKAYVSGSQPTARPDSSRKRELPAGVLSAGLVSDFSDMPRLAWLQPASTKKMHSARMTRTPPANEGASSSSSMVCSFPTREDQVYGETLKEFPIIEPTVLHTLIKQLKRNVRQNCLLVLDQWMMDCLKEAEERVELEVADEKSAYVTQTRILGPREARIREDVADVRKFELQQHRDRMVRHRIAIEQAIEEDSKQKIPSLKTALESLDNKIRRTFEKETLSLSGHSNTEIMQRLQQQMNQIAIGHMSEVRKTLIDFREAYEKRVQCLRNANVAFLKACRLFSEDGNFSAGECNAFSEELQQLSDKLTQAETEVLGRLESGEREQKELTEQLLHNFTDVFRVHLSDLIYLEGMARCLRRAQTQIKAEIADNSSQGRKLQEHLDVLEESLGELRQLPTFLPSEKTEPLNSILHAYSELVMGAGHRCLYLGCLKMQPSDDQNSTNAKLDDLQKIFAKQEKTLTWEQTSEGTDRQAHLEKLAKQVRASVSRAGRPAHDDSSVKLLQAILHQSKTQDQPSPTTNGPQRNASSDELGKESADNTTHGPRTARGKRNQARASRMQSNGGTSRVSTAIEKNLKASIEGTARSKKLVAQQIRHNPKYHVFGVSSDDPFKDSDPKRPNQRTEHTTAEESANDVAESSTFLGRVRRICRESLEAGLFLVEKYYCVKGNSPNTRPRLIHKTPELAADALLMKLQSYFDQSKAYLKKSTSDSYRSPSSAVVAATEQAAVIRHEGQSSTDGARLEVTAQGSVRQHQIDKSIERVPIGDSGFSQKEFRQQMSRLEVLCSRLARTFFDVLYGRLQRKCETALQGIEVEFREQLKQFDLQREQNYSQLHPKLGFPQFLLTEFDSLQSREERRRQDTGELFISTLRRKADVLQAACRDFAKKAPILLESLLLRFDSLVCSDEIQDDDVQQSAESGPGCNQTADRYRGKRTLPVIDWTEFSNGLRVPARLQTVAQAPAPQPASARMSVTHSRARQFQQKPPEDRDVRYRFSCGKNTEAHAVAIECMRDTMQKFLHYLQAEMQSAEMACEEGLRCSERWSEEWEMNRQLILDLNPLRKNQNMPKTP